MKLPKLITFICIRFHKELCFSQHTTKLGSGIAQSFLAATCQSWQYSEDILCHVKTCMMYLHQLSTCNPILPVNTFWVLSYYSLHQCYSLGSSEVCLFWKQLPSFFCDSGSIQRLPGSLYPERLAVIRTHEFNLFLFNSFPFAIYPWIDLNANGNLPKVPATSCGYGLDLMTEISIIFSSSKSGNGMFLKNRMSDRPVFDGLAWKASNGQWLGLSCGLTVETIDWCNAESSAICYWPEDACYVFKQN